MNESPDPLKALWEKLEALPSAMRHEARLDFLNGILGILSTSHVTRLQKLFAAEKGVPSDYLDLINGHLALRTILGAAG